MNIFAHYLNPIERLGLTKYSIAFPLLANTAACILSEIIAILIIKDPSIVGAYIVFVNATLLIYFSFRDGIRGGIIASIIPLFYYFYIIYSRHYIGNQLSGAIETTIMLGIVYLFLALTIGWLKQTIDGLIRTEKVTRKLAEEDQVRLQAILQQLPVGVMLVDAESGTSTGNKHMERILGRKSDGSLEKKSSYKSRYAYRSEKPIQQRDWPIVRALRKGETTTAEEMEYRRDDGKRLFLRVNAAPIKNKDKEIIAAVSTFYDVTQEKELEQRKDDFVNMASHELKTPITSMRLYIDLLLKRIDTSNDERALKAVTSIKRQTEKLQELVNDLLDVSRLQTGKLQFKKETFDITALIEETIDVLQETTKDHTITFQKKGKVMVLADRFRIYQVVTNLVTNAIKYSPSSEKIRITVTKENGKAVISVQDFGIGIAKEQKQKIFERLYQVTDPHEKTFPGIGMGLYIAKEIVKRHRGRIWVEGEKGKGSIFFFTLPLKKE